jgi:hypothetical protein
MKIHLLGAIFITTLFVASCSDETKRDNSDRNEWNPDLPKGAKLLRIVELAPAEVVPLKGVIESPGIFGIRVREAWELKDREDADGKIIGCILDHPHPVQIVPIW